MICLDTTFLIDLWRHKGSPQHPALALLNAYAGETMLVPVHAAGEFLEGAACISESRLHESLLFLRLFELAPATIETAQAYARVVSGLRAASRLAGTSKADLWIAACAIEHSAPLATRNTAHFNNIPALRILGY